MTAKSGSQAILEGMVAEITGRKTKGPEEKPGTAVPPPSLAQITVAAPFPNDMPIDALRIHTRALRVYARQLNELADDIDATIDAIEGNVAPPVVTESLPALVEASASPEVIAEIRAAAPAIMDLPPAVAASLPGHRSVGWVCPVHGEAEVKTSTRTGREYRVCPKCDERE